MSPTPGPESQDRSRASQEARHAPAASSGHDRAAAAENARSDTTASDTTASDTTASDTTASDTTPTPASGLAVLGAAVKEFAIVVGMALVLSFIVKTWLLQAFYIPSGSMEDTLVLNDRVIVSKLTPGPLQLRRGDIIVFADPGDWLDPVPQAPHGQVATILREAMTFVGLLPDNSENHLIKRVIGLPGDHVVCCDEGGRITINGAPIREPYLKPGDAASEQDFDITVPRGRVWVMGDHRSNSADSRAHDGPDENGTQGSVDERLIVGRAVALVWPLDHLAWLSNPTSTFASVPRPTGTDTRPGGQPSHTTPGQSGTSTPVEPTRFGSAGWGRTGSGNAGSGNAGSGNAGSGNAGFGSAAWKSTGFRTTGDGIVGAFANAVAAGSRPPQLLPGED
ncbi:signal peptidase I [Pedococcus sp. 5OH_020]|uniref:signal peptidase I n=1 Tax=Pedococcus sp. 5OH_020 TaxID=2989814 RepID=UPI0022E9EEE8|nr:signal peptidase I [Pedococcus sp. 5OH_020]